MHLTPMGSGVEGSSACLLRYSWDRPVRIESGPIGCRRPSNPPAPVSRWAKLTYFVSYLADDRLTRSMRFISLLASRCLDTKKEHWVISCSGSAGGRRLGEKGNGSPSSVAKHHSLSLRKILRPRDCAMLHLVSQLFNVVSSSPLLR